MIDPNVLSIQRADVATARGERHPTPCSRCGKRTEDKSGVCQGCQRIATLTNVSGLTTDQLVHVIAVCREELRKRRDALDRAIGGES